MATVSDAGHDLMDGVWQNFAHLLGDGGKFDVVLASDEQDRALYMFQVVPKRSHLPGAHLP